MKKLMLIFVIAVLLNINSVSAQEQDMRIPLAEYCFMQGAVNQPNGMVLKIYICNFDRFFPREYILATLTRLEQQAPLYYLLEYNLKTRFSRAVLKDITEDWILNDAVTETK